VNYTAVKTSPHRAGDLLPNFADGDRIAMLVVGDVNAVGSVRDIRDADTTEAGFGLRSSAQHWGHP
jgi:hypothetical protein